MPRGEEEGGGDSDRDGNYHNHHHHHQHGQSQSASHYSRHSSSASSSSSSSFQDNSHPHHNERRRRSRSPSTTTTTPIDSSRDRRTDYDSRNNHQNRDRDRDRDRRDDTYHQDKRRRMMDPSNSNYERGGGGGYSSSQSNRRGGGGGGYGNGGGGGNRRTGSRDGKEKRQETEKHDKKEDDKDDIDETSYVQRVQQQLEILKEEEQDDETLRRQARERRLALLAKLNQSEQQQSEPLTKTGTNGVEQKTEEFNTTTQTTTQTTTTEVQTAQQQKNNENNITDHLPDRNGDNTTNNHHHGGGGGNVLIEVPSQMRVRETRSPASPTLDIFGESPTTETSFPPPHPPPPHSHSHHIHPSSASSASSASLASATAASSIHSRSKKSSHATKSSTVYLLPQSGELTAALTDNWDDPEGYYLARMGEVIHDRYRVFGLFGKGVFSTVLRAYDLGAGPSTQGTSIDEVAIKVIRNNDSLRKAGLREIDFLKKIAEHDKHNRKHCVRLLAHFDWRNHLCIVFEPLFMNLREVLKKFGTEQGKEIGINIEAVQLYTKQLCIALRHLKQCNLLHADIKPDNILVNEKKNIIKLCDFGSASYVVDNTITPYLVSRFYRAPEIILGLRYDFALDMWSVGCTLFELYTGKILFPGATNNDMLRLIMEVKGKFPNRLLKKAAFRERHFDENFNFLHQELDKVSQQVLRRKITITGPTKDMFSMLHDASKHEEDPTSRKRVVQFRDLLEKMLTLDPAARITPDQVLQHAFLQALPTQ